MAIALGRLHQSSSTPSTLSAASALKPRRASSPSRWAGVRPAAVREASSARAASSSPASAARTPARERGVADGEPLEVGLDPPRPPAGREPLLGERERQRLVVDVAEPLEIVEHGLADIGRGDLREPLRERRARERPTRQRLAGRVERSLAYVVHPRRLRVAGGGLSRRRRRRP